MHIRVCSHTATHAALEQQLAYMLCSYTYCLSSSTALEQQLARVTAERDALVDLCDQTLPETRAGNDNNDKSVAAAAAGGPTALRRLAIDEDLAALLGNVLKRESLKAGDIFLRKHQSLAEGDRAPCAEKCSGAMPAAAGPVCAL